VSSKGSPGARATTAPGAQRRAGGARMTAPFGRRLLTVAGIDELGAYRVLRVADPEGPVPEPGQFAMLAAAERWGGGQDERPYLPRAFSYARHGGGEAHFLLEDVGPGTRRLCELRAGDGLWALGPLGQGFLPPGDERRKPILVGGGVGIAPLAMLNDTLPAQATTLLGFRDAARARGASLLGEAQLASDDGSVGYHGPVTHLLAGELQRDSTAAVYACGPPRMLEAVRALCAAHGTPGQLALEAAMACGFGACFGCVVPRRGGGYLRVCLDGPVLDAAELERVHDHAGESR
jgi:dihydroorotate dehydrogenase electron transfer subunit